MRTKLMARSALTAWILLAVWPALAGTVTLSWNGDQYTLVAQEASLHDVLNEIDFMTHAFHDLQAPFEKTISATYRDVSLETILDQLGVQYHRGGSRPAACAYHRRNAPAEGSPEQGLDQETEAYIRKLIRYLEDDDIEFNAIHAYKRLPRLGCAARPFLEQALYSDDLQLRYAAADLLRQGGCRHAEISDRLIEVTFTGLDEDINRSGWLHTIGINAGFGLFQRTDVYARVRDRILANLGSELPRTRLYSSLLAAHHGEAAYLPQLVQIMAPHLADNDLPGDAAVCSYALYRLGPDVLPYLRPYLDSGDVQQEELARLICRVLEEGKVPARFHPVMYCGYVKNPVAKDMFPYVTAWSADRFPDADGRYRNLKQPRKTAREIYNRL